MKIWRAMPITKFMMVLAFDKHVVVYVKRFAGCQHSTAMLAFTFPVIK